MKLTLRQNISLFFIILFVCLYTACGQKPSSALRLGTNVWPGYEPLYLARELELWQDGEIRLVEYPSASEVLRAFRNKALDAASLTLDEALLLRQLNIPVKVILVHDISEGADVIIAKPDIQTVKDLRGKRVGVESGALGALVVTRALELNNMVLGDIEISNIDVNLHERAFYQGDIDAVVTFEPVRTRLLSTGANEIFSSREMPGEIVDVLVVHQNSLDKNPKIIKKLINGWFKSLAHLKTNNADAAQRIAARLKLTPQEVNVSYQGLSLPDRKENLALLGGENAKLRKTIKHLTSVMIKNNLLADNVNTDDLLTDKFIIDSK